MKQKYKCGCQHDGKTFIKNCPEGRELSSKAMVAVCTWGILSADGLEACKELLNHLGECNGEVSS